MINLVIAGLRILAVVDTAAQITIMSQQFWARVSSQVTSIGTPLRIRNAEISSYMNCTLFRQVPFTIGHAQYCHDVAVGPISDDFIIGLDFLLQQKAVIDLHACTVYLKGVPVPAQMIRGSGGNVHHVATVTVSRNQSISPLSTRLISVKLSNQTSVPFVTSPIASSTFVIPSCLLSGGNDNYVLEVTNDSTNSILLREAQVITGACEADLLECPEQEPKIAAVCVCQETSLPTEEEVNRLNAERPLVSSHALPKRGCDLKKELLDATNSLPLVVKTLYERSETKLTSAERIALCKVLTHYADTFANSKEDLGQFSLVKHRILTTDEAPVQERMRRTPIKFVNEEESTLKSMLQAGVIRPSTSSWASAPVLVRKKDGEVRYTVDYRKVNAKTIRDVYPLPLISECIDALEGTLWFHTLDLASGYWQIDIDPRDCHKTAFITRHGLFEHVRLAQGLCNAPATFQRVMHLVLRGLTWDRALVYLDDVIVMGRDFMNALENLERVLQRFQSHNLKLKPKKCNLFCTEVNFLGRHISRDGVAMSSDHIKSVKDWPTPTTVEELQKFLGFINYHREFIPRLSLVASPLFALTRKNVDFQWDNRCMEAFNNLKKTMTSPPVLSFPNNRDPFVLDTDASDLALGACLYQVRDGKEYPVSYSSVLLTPAQRKYCTTRKELLAIVLFTRQYRHYLLGGEFTIRTDHHSLAWLCGFKDCSGQLGRWLEELSQYHLNIQHRPGAKHTNADAMSRIPIASECNCYEAGKNLSDLPCGGCNYCQRIHSQWEHFEEDVDYVVPLGVRSIQAVDDGCITTIHGYSKQELKTLQHDDPELNMIHNWLTGNPPSQAELQLQGHNVKKLWRHKDQLLLKDGVLYHNWISPALTNHPRLLVPQSLRSEVLHLAHDTKSGGHWGRDKTMARLLQSFYWPRMRRDVDLHISTCRACTVNKHQGMPRRAMQNYQAGEPNERVHLDFLGPFETSNQGNKYILSIVDQFTRWIEIYALPEQTAIATSKTFFNGWIARFGTPTIVHTDQGRNFTSQLFQDLCSYLECTKTRTTPYRPNSNGQVERYNRMILTFIRCFIAGNDRDWDQHLAILGMSLRSTVNRTTGFTANMLMLGRELKMPWDVVFGADITKSPYSNIPDYVQDILRRMESVFAAAREKIGTAQMTQKVGYDGRSKLRHTSFDIGDLVYTINASIPVGCSRKLQPVLKGPFVVTKSLSPSLYVVRDRRKNMVLHHDRLRLCEDREVPHWVHRVRTTLNAGPSAYEESECEDQSECMGLDTLFQPHTRDEVVVDAHSTVNSESEFTEGNHPQAHGTQEIPACSTPLIHCTVEEEPRVTRRGRKVVPPKHLQHYVL